MSSFIYIPNITTLARMVSKNFLTEHFIINGIEKMKIGRIEGEGWFAITCYTISSLICIPNMTTLACMVAGLSLTKHLRGWTEGRIDGRTDSEKFFKAGI